MTKKWIRTCAAALLALSLICGAALAEAPKADLSPALYVAQKTAGSVVGILSSKEYWDGQSTTTQAYTQGSGVVVKDGGYILTNYHVVDTAYCNVYEVLLPSGEYVSAEYIGADSTLDVAVLRAESDELVTAEIGSTADLQVGSTAVAIGNPGGDVLANTVTQGVISALERDVSGRNTSRAVAYIQHDAAISSGSSGGDLFDYRGRLVGINTLKYAGSVYSSVSFEGLGFALPIDTVMPLVEQIIEFGKVIRPQMGVSVTDWDGPDEPIASYPPAGVVVASVVEGSPAEAAGILPYDFITEIDGERVKSFRELSTVLDAHEAGDTVTVTVARYEGIEAFLDYFYNSSSASATYGSMFGYFNTVPTLSRYEVLKLDVTLKILD